MNLKRLPGILCGLLLVGSPFQGGSNALRWPWAFAEEARSHDLPTPADDTPRLQLAERVLDFGGVAPNAQVAHTVQVRNVGQGPLEIFGLKASCRCLTIHASATAIEPGGRGNIDVAFDATGRQGPQHKTIVLQTNDPLNPEVRIKIRAVVKGAFTVTPPYLRFGEVQVGQAVSEVLVVTPVGEGQSRVTSVTSTSRHFVPALSETPLSDGTQRYLVTVTLRLEAPFRSPSGKQRVLRGKLRLLTDSPQQPVLEVPVTASLSPT